MAPTWAWNKEMVRGRIARLTNDIREETDTNKEREKRLILRRWYKRLEEIEALEKIKVMK